MGFGISQHEGGLVIYIRINVRLNLLSDGRNGQRALSVHQPRHEIGPITAEIEEGAGTVQFRVRQPVQELRLNSISLGP